MQILVIGASGFIGRPMVRALKALGHNIIQPSHASANVLDPAQRASLIRESDADVLVHLAWQTTHGAFWTSPDNTDWRDATIALVQEFLDAGGKRVVLAGSCAEYDWTTNAVTLTENSPCVPATLYGRSKLETFQACSRLIDAGASIAWGRLFFLMGRHETPTRFMPAIIRPLLRGDTAPMSDGSGLRDFMHAEDAGSAFASLTTSNATGAINIASGTPVTLVEVARQAQALIGHGELDIGAIPSREGEPEALVADVTRLHDEVGFSPRYQLKSALEDCISFWREHDALQ
ncbi:MAG: NAD-dependent epimerase/dehydratase family protein [Candidatus Phaeomarinobacter sp.]